jgi:polygalacturonase
LDFARVNGGTVLVPPGEYLCGPLHLYSRTNLEISKGATLHLINDIETFPHAAGHYLNFLDASEGTDIKISGGGKIDGQGEVWWKATEAKLLSFRRPQLLYADRTRRIEITGVTFLNPPNTHLSLKNSTDVYIHDLVMQAPSGSHNTDGINISAKFCTIDHCTINTGDDNIAINFGDRLAVLEDPEVRNMVINNCFFGYGHGLSIGSYTSGNLINLFVKDCTFDGTTSAIRIKSARGRGGTIENVTYENITIKNSRYPIFISAYYPHEPEMPQEDMELLVGSNSPLYKNILLKNITVTNAQEAIIIWGLPESPIRDVLFDNIKISSVHGIKIYNAANVKFINSSINVTSGDKLKLYKATVSGLF